MMVPVHTEVLGCRDLRMNGQMSGHFALLGVGLCHLHRVTAMTQELAPTILRLRKGGGQGTGQEAPAPSCPKVRRSERAATCVSMNEHKHPCVCAGALCVKRHVPACLETSLPGQLSAPLGLLCLCAHGRSCLCAHECVSTHECGPEPGGVCLSAHVSVHMHACPCIPESHV